MVLVSAITFLIFTRRVQWVYCF